MTVKVTTNTIFRAPFLFVSRKQGDFAGTGKIQFSMNFPDFFLNSRNHLNQMQSISEFFLFFHKKRPLTLLRALVNMEPEKE